MSMGKNIPTMVGVMIVAIGAWPAAGAGIQTPAADALEQDVGPGPKSGAALATVGLATRPLCVMVSNVDPCDVFQGASPCIDASDDDAADTWWAAEVTYLRGTGGSFGTAVDCGDDTVAQTGGVSSPNEWDYDAGVAKEGDMGCFIEIHETLGPGEWADVAHGCEDPVDIRPPTTPTVIRFGPGTEDITITYMGGGVYRYQG